MDEIGFYTNEELITELLRRATFAGIVILPAEPMEEIEDQPFVQFNANWNDRLPVDSVKKILWKVLENLEYNEQV